MTDNTQAEALAALIERFRGLHIDHKPDGWPAVRTREITALLDRIAELEAQLEAIGAGGVSALMGVAKAGSDGVASLPLPGAQEPVAPHGWLYDWTHSSATGRPDETYTGFTKDEQHARKHDNCTPVYTAPQPALSAGWRDISTAPKDGTELLLWREDCGQFIGSYTSADGFPLTQDEIDAMDEETLFTKDWFTQWPDARRLDGSEAPIKWQPLPVAPSKDGESNG